MKCVWLENEAGDCARVDTSVGRLTLPDGKCVSLRPRASQVLEVLVRNPGKLVSKEHLLNSVWSGEIVVDGVLRNAISDLRKSLSALDPDAIISVPRKGYRLTLAPTHCEDGRNHRSPNRRLWMYAAMIGLPVLIGATLSVGSDSTAACAVRLGHQVDPAQPLRVPSNTSIDVAERDFSISAWIQVQGERGTLLDKRELQPEIRGIAMALYDRRLLLQLATPEQGWMNFLALSHRVRTDGSWAHVAVAVDRDVAWGGTFYVNGNVAGTFDASPFSASLSTSQDMLVGNSYDFPDPFPGRIDHLQFYDQALTTNDVIGLYQELKQNRTCAPST